MNFSSTQLAQHNTDLSSHQTHDFSGDSFTHLMPPNMTMGAYDETSSESSTSSPLNTVGVLQTVGVRTYVTNEPKGLGQLLRRK